MTNMRYVGTLFSRFQTKPVLNLRSDCSVSVARIRKCFDKCYDNVNCWHIAGMVYFLKTMRKSIFWHVTARRNGVIFFWQAQSSYMVTTHLTSESFFDPDILL